MDRDMIIRDHEGICHTEVGHLADLWDAAYPLMREVATNRINGLRKYLKEGGWKAWDELQPNPDATLLRKVTADSSRADCERRLKAAEELRLALGQLDRGTYKACTRSPGAFSVRGAYVAVRNVLKASSSSTEGMAVVYRLGATLAEMHDRQLDRMRERNS